MVIVLAGCADPEAKVPPGVQAPTEQAVAPALPADTNGTETELLATPIGNPTLAFEGCSAVITGGTRMYVGPPPVELPDGWQSGPVHLYLQTFMRCERASVGTVEGPQAIILEYLSAGLPPDGCLADDAEGRVHVLVKIMVNSTEFMEALANLGVPAAHAAIEVREDAANLSEEWSWTLTSESKVSFSYVPRPLGEGNESRHFYWYDSSGLHALKWTAAYGESPRDVVNPHTATFGEDMLYPGPHVNNGSVLSADVAGEATVLQDDEVCAG